MLASLTKLASMSSMLSTNSMPPSVGLALVMISFAIVMICLCIFLIIFDINVYIHK